ncbi:MAG: glutamate--tRNA ligase family protein, partial [Pseudomonadota bacterium]
VEAYREMGYLPAALRNYLVRLGWSHGDEEIFSTDEMVKLFGLDAVGKSPARFDFAKLADMNGIHMRGMDDTDLTEAAKAVMPEIADGVQKEAAFAAVGWDKFDAVVPTLKERSKTLVELIDGAGFLTAKRPLEIQPKAQKQLGDEGKAHLAALKHKFEAMETWTLETVEATVRGYCEEAGVGLGKAAQPLRAALSGSNVSPPIFHLIWVLGRDEAVARIADQVGG